MQKFLFKFNKHTIYVKFLKGKAARWENNGPSAFTGEYIRRVPHLHNFPMEKLGILLEKYKYDDSFEAQYIAYRLVLPRAPINDYAITSVMYSDKDFNFKEDFFRQLKKDFIEIYKN